jgi:predicted PurR-regulated permease PerM
MAEAGAKAVSAVFDVVLGLTKVILVIVLAAFLVHRPDAYRRGLRQLVPREHEDAFDEAWGRVHDALRRWVGGILVAMLIMGTLTAIGLLAIGMDDWLLLGFLTFLGTFVPYVGAVASAVPGLLVALGQSPRTFALALLVYLGVHVVEGYIVEPLVMRRAVELRPALLLFGQGLLGAVFGAIGFVVATPLVVSGQILVDYLWVERRLGKTVH